MNPPGDVAPIGRYSRLGILEGPGTVNLSMGVGKSFPIAARFVSKIEGSFTHLLNHLNLADPKSLNITAGSFWQSTSERGSGFGDHRTGQVSAQIEF